MPGPHPAGRLPEDQKHRLAGPGAWRCVRCGLSVLDFAAEGGPCPGRPAPRRGRPRPPEGPR